MRTEIKRLHQDLGASMVYVTHDQIEAMTLATRIVVMKGGVIQQIGSPGARHGAHVVPARCLVEVVEPAGADTYVVSRLGGAAVTARLSAETRAQAGQPLDVAFDLAKASFFEPRTGARLN